MLKQAAKWREQYAAITKETPNADPVQFEPDWRDPKALVTAVGRGFRWAARAIAYLPSSHVTF